MSTRTLFHSLQYDDPAAGARFLEAVGFTRAAWYTDPEDESIVVHAQYDWRDTGGVMFGSARRRDGDADGWVRSTGHGQCYCVAATDEDVRAVYRAALDAGATSIQEPTEMDYGGVSCSLRDREGNQWSFGTYAGE